MSLLAAVIGWAGAVVIWAASGDPAGIDPAFIFALSVAIASSIIWARAMADRDTHDQERVYALGVQRGMALAAEVRAQERSGEPRLRAVR